MTDGFAYDYAHAIHSHHRSWQFEKLAAAIGMPELSQDARFRTNRDRTQNRAALIPILEAKFRCVGLLGLQPHHTHAHAP